MKRERHKSIAGVNAAVAARCQEFLERHGGPGEEEVSEGESEDGWRGWSELSAADGYKLRCDWFRIGDQEQLTFSEIPPEQKRV
jgi:hypothetical protein